MKHYTFSLLTSTLIILSSLASLHAKKSSYSLYDKCEEYYDSRGFYHRDCKKNRFDKRKLKKAYRTLLDDFEPGTGEENNETAVQAPVEVAASSAIDDIIEDDQIEQNFESNEDEEQVPETPAISEQPEFEFGREDP